MIVNKKDIMEFLKKREEELKNRMNKSIVFQQIEQARLQECIYIKEMISLIWNIIHQKKEK